MEAQAVTIVADIVVRHHQHAALDRQSCFGRQDAQEQLVTIRA